MRNTLKISLFFLVLVAVLLVIPNMVNAADLEANDETTLRNQINVATPDDVIVLTDNITVNGPIPVTGGKTITIDGQNFKITGSESWKTAGGSGDQSIFTAVSAGNTITLKNITLENGPKYGVQAFDNGSVILDNVTINNCSFGGVLVNGGTVTIKSLNLGLNGDPAKGYNGIELGKGNTTENPVLVMDGTIKSEQTENVVHLATNDNLTTYEVENGANAVNKIAVSGNKVVITDENDKVIYTSNEPVKGDGTPITGSEQGDTTAKYIVTIEVTNGQKTDTIEILVDENTVLNADDLNVKLNVQEGYTAKYYSDADNNALFDLDKAITANTNIYAVIEEDKEPSIPTDPDIDNPGDVDEPSTPGDETNPGEEVPAPGDETNPGEEVPAPGDETNPGEEVPAPGDETNPDEETTVPSEEVEQGEKDETPKTGVSTYIGVSAFVIVASVATIVVLKKKN